jgi:tetratricopeptide (TPR) repeat protein
LPANEQHLIAALSARYASPDPAARARLDSAYAVAMRQVASAHPNDDEVRTLFADAIMNVSPWNYWNADRSPRSDTPTLLGELEAVLARNKDHPGACHLFIHAVEMVDPARGVPCAERLAALMPGAGHLVHMPGHIYIRVGRYADALRVNEHAVHADESFYEGANLPKRGFYSTSYYPHNYHFLAFAASMMGASQVAIDNAFRAAKAVDPAVALQNPWIEAITPAGYLTLVTFGRWNEILSAPLPNGDLRFAMGMAYYARGVAFSAKKRWAEARTALDTVAAIAEAFAGGENKIALQIAEHALAGEIALRRGATGEAIRAFRAAVTLEDRLVYAEPPTWYYPVRQSLGKALLAAGRYRDAERVYREDLARFAENGGSLYGLYQSLLRQGRPEQAREVKQRFAVAWAGADVQLSASRF